MKVLFNSIDAEASGSLRVLNPLRDLQKKGLVEIQTLNTEDARSQMRWADLLVLQCVAGPQHFNLVKKFQEAGIKVVIDYDDNFAHLPEHVLQYLKLSQAEVTENWIKYINMADLVTVSSPYLAESVQKLTQTGHIQFLPNLLSAEEYKKASDYIPKENGEIRILYSCSNSHAKDLAWISNLLLRIGKSYPNVRLITQGKLNLSYLNPTYRGKISHELSVPYASYYQRLREISPHICIAPLIDDELAYCRSNLKYLETALTKAVFIGSKAPPYQSTVLHGKTGFLAGNRLSWWWYLRNTIRNPNLRQEISYKAFLHAGNFLLEDHSHRWYDLYSNLLK